METFRNCHTITLKKVIEKKHKISVNITKKKLTEKDRWLAEI